MLMSRWTFLPVLAVLCGGISNAAPVSTDMTISGPQGALAGTFLSSGDHAPIVLMIPGSGPTDRDGNSATGMRPATLRLLAEGLANRGISSVRIDKRGMFGSQAAIPDANKVTISDYVDDVRNWVGAIRKKTGVRCVWVLGHSEGGLVALAAAQKPDGICGLLLLSTAAVSMDRLIGWQLRRNPANAPLLPQADIALARLKAGEHFDDSGLAVPLRPLFSKEIQGYLIDVMHYDPLKLASKISLPVLIVQGGRDVQVFPRNAEMLKAVCPKAEVLMVSQMTHVLKTTPGSAPQDMLRTYTDASLPLSPEIVPSVAQFVLRH